MRHSTSLLTPAQCLLGALSPIPQRTRACALRAPQASYSLYTKRQAQHAFLSRKSVASVNPKRQDLLSDFVKDESIDAPAGVQVSQDGKLAPPEHLMNALSRLDQNEEHLVLLQPPIPERPTAVVKVFKRSELVRQKLDKQKAQQKQQKSLRDRAPKQLELNWAIGPHDLDIKLGHLESFIGKGKTVEIILAAKRKQRKASVAEGEAVLMKIRDKVGDIDAREVKAMEGQVLKQAVLTVRKKGLD